MGEDKGNIEIARTLMKEIMYCNGMVNRWEPEWYPKKWVNKIASIAGGFFEANPKILTNDHIRRICDGEEGENEKIYGKLEGWKELNQVLDDYFNDPKPNPKRIKLVLNESRLPPK